MAAKKKASSKKASSKKTAAASRVKLNFALDENKIRAIQNCLAKGTLTVTVKRTDLGAKRIGDAWLYD